MAPDWTDTLDARQAGTEPGFNSVHARTEDHEDPIAETTGHQERLDVARAIAEEGRKPSRTNPVASVDPDRHAHPSTPAEPAPSSTPTTTPAREPATSEPAPTTTPETEPAASEPATTT